MLRAATTSSPWSPAPSADSGADVAGSSVAADRPSAEDDRRGFGGFPRATAMLMGSSACFCSGRSWRLRRSGKRPGLALSIDTRRSSAVPSVPPRTRSGEVLIDTVVYRFGDAAGGLVYAVRGRARVVGGADVDHRMVFVGDWIAASYVSRGRWRTCGTHPPTRVYSARASIPVLDRDTISITSRLKVAPKEMAYASPVELATIGKFTRRCAGCFLNEVPRPQQPSAADPRRCSALRPSQKP